LDRPSPSLVPPLPSPHHTVSLLFAALTIPGSCAHHPWLPDHPNITHDLSSPSLAPRSSTLTIPGSPIIPWQLWSSVGRTSRAEPTAAPSATSIWVRARPPSSPPHAATWPSPPHHPVPPYHVAPSSPPRAAATWPSPPHHPVLPTRGPLLLTTPCCRHVAGKISHFALLDHASLQREVLKEMANAARAALEQL
jgi:hypothetical protein